MEELTTYQQPKFMIHFKDGGYHVVSKEMELKINDIWNRDKNARLRFGDVTRVAGDIKRIEPVKRDGFVETSMSNLARIQKYVIDSTNSNPTIREKWFNHIKENVNRLENKEKWQYADKNCKPCTKEEARQSVFGGDLYEEANARISELRKEGYIFKDCGKDEHGFTIHQLIEDTSYFEKQKSEPLKIEFGNTKTLYELRKKR